MLKPIICLFGFFLFHLMACTSPQNETKEVSTAPITQKNSLPPPPILKFEPFDRSLSLKRMQQKIANNEPLVIHVFVPLCDNDHQGIVPVNANLGNGLNLKSNLYWGAKYGVKSYFKSLNDWKLIDSQKDPSEKVLERVIFSKNYGKGKQVYLIADAYRGDHMRDCLIDYFQSLAGKKSETILVNNQNIKGYQAADLLVFNGHNGLMDTTVESIYNQDGIQKDAAVIACASADYFNEPLNFLKAYPVLTTTNLLAPEAYVLESLINNWANLNTGVSFKTTAGKAYHRFQNCGVKGATRLFKTGW